MLTLSRTTRGALIALLAALVLAAPAQAAFQTCTYNAGVVTATFGTGVGGANPTGTLAQSGVQIRADGVQCGGAATTANTDLIRVIGQNGVGEELTISLAGGTFLGGATDEPGTSDEIEFAVDLGSGFGSPDVTILGTAGVDHVTLGENGTGASATSAVNLNANEADPKDADMTFSTFELFEVLGGGSGDVLSGAGGDGTGTRSTQNRLRGEAGNDVLRVGDRAFPGPGNDTVEFPVAGVGIVEYTDAPAGTVITLSGGGGIASNDGDGGADTYIGVADHYVGSSTGGDTFTGSVNDDQFFGLGGTDTIDGGAGDDQLAGNNGTDTIHGGADDDDVTGGAGADQVFGDDGDDLVDGGNGNDTELGGAGDDTHRQSGVNQFEGEETNPNGADDVSGGSGIDTLEYGDPGSPTFGGLAISGRDTPVVVDLDDVADDGAAGEGDNARTDVENVVGGAANDTLTGDGDANVLSGFDGADTLRGGGGEDTLRGFGSRGPFGPTIEAELLDDADDLDGGAGTDRIDANEGDDKIEAREGTADTLDCGPGFDSGRGDRVDTINADCEAIALPDLPVDPPAPPPALQTTPPPGPPPPGTPLRPIPPPVVVPRPATVAQFLTLPNNRRCVSRRRFRVKVISRVRGQVRSVTIFVNGRRAKRVTGRGVALPIDLRGLPKGRVKVRLRVDLADGRSATDTRTYRTCAPKRRGR